MTTNYNLFTIAAGTVASMFFLLTLSTGTLTPCNKHDRKALLAFKDSFASNPFYRSSPDWMSNSTKDCCFWDHVGCDITTGRITSFSLFTDGYGPTDVSLNGSLPDVLGDLTALEILAFVDMPDLVGPIPSQLSNLKRLQQLILRGNLSGPVPSFLSRMPALEIVDFRNNKFTGTIPPSLGNLERLKSLTLFSNQLTGTIPSTLFSRVIWTNIFLDLSSNKLTGTIPHSFANVDFSDFHVDNNQLTGDASFLLGKNKKIYTLILDYNKFAFDLTKVEYPATLTYLTLSNNKIYGSISNQITELPNLGTLDVSHNKLCGKIPSGGYFKNFTSDFFANNKCLCGTPLPACK